VALSKADIGRMIPHAGAMCLLDGVVRWDAEKIRCVSTTHAHADNPLRAGGKLAALCGIEYAAQAMAVHGRLTAHVHARPQAGFLVSLRDVSCFALRLDDLPGELVVDAEKVMGDDNRVTYQFRLWVAEIEVLSGRATVMLDVKGIA
jgi:predicted hotdog family 3-hydroxylacyl-ACP dehydratase